MLVSYDLRKDGQNYDALYEVIKSQGAWWHNLGSTWLVKTSLSTMQLRDQLAAVADSNDKILVIDVSGDPRSWRGFSDSGSAWLRDTF